MTSFRVFSVVTLLLLNLGVFLGDGLSTHNVSTRPAIVNVGAIFTFDSTIGRVAKVAIQEAVKDINADSTVLPGTTLVMEMRSSNCSGFLGMVGGKYVFLPNIADYVLCFKHMYGLVCSYYSVSFPKMQCLNVHKSDKKFTKHSAKPLI